MPKQRPFWLCILFTLVLFGAACSGDDDGDNTGDGGADSSGDESAASDTDSTSGSGGSDSDDSGAGDSGASDSTGGGDDDEPDDDDAAEILGDPDLDLEDLPDEAADALDAIDDVVSIGDCQSEVIGLAITAPEGWMCRVLDQSIGGMDGFTLFTEGNELNLTIGTPSPIAPCEVLLACDTAVDIALSDLWPGTQLFEIAGTVTIWGDHPTADGQLIITKLSELTDDELELIMTVLDSTVEVG